MPVCTTTWAGYWPARGGSTKPSRSSRRPFASNRISRPLARAWKPHWRDEAEGSVLDAETFQRSLGGLIPGGGCLAIPDDGLVAVRGHPESPLPQYADVVHRRVVFPFVAIDRHATELAAALEKFRDGRI